MVPVVEPFSVKCEAASLTSIIMKYVLAGSVVTSDSWKACCELSREIYTHKVINNSENFVHLSDSEVQKQNIERL